MNEILLETVVILLLITVNGLLAMSEMAIVSSRRVRLQQMAQDGNYGAEVALELVETPNRFLSTVQVGITLVGIFAGAVGGATIARALADLLAQLPVLEPYAAAISLFLVVGTITLLTVVLGELVPKRVALHNTERIAVAIARPMRALWCCRNTVRSAAAKSSARARRPSPAVPAACSAATLSARRASSISPRDWPWTLKVLATSCWSSSWMPGG